MTANETALAKDVSVFNGAASTMLNNNVLKKLRSLIFELLKAYSPAWEYPEFQNILPSDQGAQLRNV